MSITSIHCNILGSVPTPSIVHGPLMAKIKSTPGYTHAGGKMPGILAGNQPIDTMDTVADAIRILHGRKQLKNPMQCFTSFVIKTLFYKINIMKGSIKPG